MRKLLFLIIFIPAFALCQKNRDTLINDKFTHSLTYDSVFYLGMNLRFAPKHEYLGMIKPNPTIYDVYRLIMKKYSTMMYGYYKSRDQVFVITKQ